MVKLVSLMSNLGSVIVSRLNTFLTISRERSRKAAALFERASGKITKEAPRHQILVPVGVFLFFSIAVLFPLLKPGYVLTLDMVFPPYRDLSNIFFGLEEFDPPYIIAISPLYGLIGGLATVVPMWLVQKLILITTFLLAGFGAYRLASRVGANMPASIYAGLLYAFNPFVQERFLAGHWKILLGYGLLPAAVLVFWMLLVDERRRVFVGAVSLTTFIAIVSIHVLALLLMVYSAMALVYLITSGPRERMIVLARLAALTLVFAGLNAYWLIPTYLAETTIVDQFGQSDLSIFSADFGRLFDVLGMYGFWREDAYFLTKDLVRVWFVPVILFLFLAVFGTVSFWSHRSYRALVFPLAGLAVVGLVLASGVHGPFEKFLSVFYDNFYPLRGFRDTHKFVILIALSLSVLGAMGLSALAGMVHRRVYAGILAVSMLAVVLYSVTMFNGFWGQLRSTQYPAGWVEADSILQRDEGEFNVLVLPWHGYMYLSDARQTVLNPARVFFTPPVLQSVSLDQPGITTQSQDPVKGYVRFLVQNRESIDNFGELVAPLGARYVILLKEANYQSYRFLYDQTDIDIVVENDDLVLFRNSHATPLLWQSDQMNIVESKEEFLARSFTEDVTKGVWLLATEAARMGIRANEANDECSTVNSTKRYRLSSVSIELTDPPGCRFLIFPGSSNPNWTYADQEPLTTIAGVNVYVGDPFATRLEYIRYGHYRLGYIVTAVSLAVFLLVSLVRRRPSSG